MKGKQAVMVVVMKARDASTLEVVNGVTELIPQMTRMLPKGVQIKVPDGCVQVCEGLGE